MFLLLVLLVGDIQTVNSFFFLLKEFNKYGELDLYLSVRIEEREIYNGSTSWKTIIIIIFIKIYRHIKLVINSFRFDHETKV